MSRLDLLKQNTTTSSDTTKKPRDMGEPNHQQRDDDYGKKYFNKRREGGRRNDSRRADEDEDRRGPDRRDDDRRGVVQDVDDLGKTVEFETETEADPDNNKKETEEIVGKETEEKSDVKAEAKPAAKNKIRAADHESAKIIRYNEDDIKLELEYTFSHREDAFQRRVKSIIGGGLEISTDKILQLDNIVRLSVEIEELREKITCEGRVISVSPRNIRSEDKDNPYSYIVQLVGELAPDLDKVMAKYLLGYKMK